MAKTATKKTAQTSATKNPAQKGQTKKVTAPKAAPKAPKATAAAPKPEAAAEAKAPREGSKKALVVSMIQRSGGATRTQLEKATGWNGTFVHGFISWTVKKKMGLNVAQVKENGEWTYSIAS